MSSNGTRATASRRSLWGEGVSPRRSDDSAGLLALAGGVCAAVGASAWSAWL